MILFLKSLISLIVNTPRLIELFLIIEKKINEAEDERKTKDEINAIKEAFKNSDASLLKSVFNRELRESAKKDAP